MPAASPGDSEDVALFCCRWMPCEIDKSKLSVSIEMKQGFFTEELQKILQHYIIVEFL